MSRFSLFGHIQTDGDSSPCLNGGTRWLLLLLCVNFLLQLDFVEKFFDGPVIASESVLAQSEVCGSLLSIGTYDSTIHHKSIGLTFGALPVSDSKNVTGIISENPCRSLDIVRRLNTNYLSPSFFKNTQVFSGLSPPIA